MRQPSEISKERDGMAIMTDLTSAFEGIASMRIAQIKTQVQSSEQFFGELWKIYSQIRVDELFHFGRSQSVEKIIDKELLILITSEGSFSGDIDDKLLTESLGYYHPEKNDIIIIGHHGAIRLAQRDIHYTRSFKLPKKDRNINVGPIVGEVQRYASTLVYYQAYVSLMKQEVRHIKLSTAVAERGKAAGKAEETITEGNYIFEPSTYEVIDHLERSMMQVALSEVILESKLAQYASRFKAMSAAHERADESLTELNTLFRRSKRHIKDERLKEVVNSQKRLSQ